MQISDFHRVQSVHGLAMLLFASEIGLLSVSSPDTQHVALTEAFTTLREIVVSQVRDVDIVVDLPLFSGVPADLLAPKVTGAQEAQLFIGIYGRMARITDSSQLLLDEVYPAIGRAITAAPVLHAHLLAAIRAFVDKWGDAVRQRVQGQLTHVFGLPLMADALQLALPADESTTPEAATT